MAVLRFTTLRATGLRATGLRATGLRATGLRATGLRLVTAVFRVAVFRVAVLRLGRGLEGVRNHMDSLTSQKKIRPQKKTPMVRLEDIHAKYHKRAEINHETYKTLFRECSERINRRADMHHLPQTVEYRVPPWVVDRPPYTHDHAVRYVSEKLRRNGFDVFVAPGSTTVVVSWKPPTRTPSRPPAARPPAARPPAARPPAAPKTKLGAKLEALRRKFA